MKRSATSIIAALVFILLFGGWGMFAETLGVIGEVFIAFFPIFFDVAKSSIEDYLTSPYFITGVVMSIASAFGIWFGAKGGKILFLTVSIIFEIASVVSILANVL